MQISEWLPNPTGKDSGNEWVELFNNEEVAVNLTGWRIENYKKIEKKLSAAEVLPGERVLFLGKSLGITFRNQNDSLRLIDGSGKEVDRGSFSGEALEGYSYGRDSKSEWTWLRPTPGQLNSESALPHLADVGYVKNESGLIMSDFIIMLVGASILIVCYLIYTVRQDDYLAKLFTEGD
jgi:hypothetical protein